MQVKSARSKKLTLRSIGVDHVIDLQPKWSIIDPTWYWACLWVEWIEPLRPAESSSSEAVWYVFEAEKLSEVSMLQCWDSSNSALSHAVPVRRLCFGLIHTVIMKVRLPLFCVPFQYSPMTNRSWGIYKPCVTDRLSLSPSGHFRQYAKTSFPNHPLRHSPFTWKLDISLIHSHPTNFLSLPVHNQVRWHVTTVVFMQTPCPFIFCSTGDTDTLCTY